MHIDRVVAFVVAFVLLIMAGLFIPGFLILSLKVLVIYWISELFRFAFNRD